MCLRRKFNPYISIILHILPHLSLSFVEMEVGPSSAMTHFRFTQLTSSNTFWLRSMQPPLYSQPNGSEK